MSFYSGIRHRPLAYLHLNREAQKPGDDGLRQAFGPESVVLLVLGSGPKALGILKWTLFSFCCVCMSPLELSEMVMPCLEWE